MCKPGGAVDRHSARARSRGWMHNLQNESWRVWRDDDPRLATCFRRCAAPYRARCAAQGSGVVSRRRACGSSVPSRRCRRSWRLSSRRGRRSARLGDRRGLQSSGARRRHSRRGRAPVRRLRQDRDRWHARPRRRRSAGCALSRARRPMPASPAWNSCAACPARSAGRCRMNAGCYGREIKDIFVEATAMDGERQQDHACRAPTWVSISQSARRARGSDFRRSGVRRHARRARRDPRAHGRTGRPTARPASPSSPRPAARPSRIRPATKPGS